MKDWEKKLAHERAVRDAWVACGNPAPDKPDPPGGLIQVEPRIFNARTAHQAMVKAGHSNLVFETCKCFKETTHG